MARPILSRIALSDRVRSIMASMYEYVLYVCIVVLFRSADFSRTSSCECNIACRRSVSIPPCGFDTTLIRLIPYTFQKTCKLGVKPAKKDSRKTKRDNGGRQWDIIAAFPSFPREERKK